ncbi:HAAS signaling domain-containing protein [Alicyclobacillus fodiniaquatilis]|uniref:Uncharacterized protein n=1 Tax=Alicyclobacillus fodiniaquatilis TaxID=1661150 RepID=A0ABW4JFU9_9BACL
MEMVERYIYAVTRRLREKQREDIAQELRVLIEDMLDTRAAEHEPTVSDVETVLKELGEPSKLAARYADRPRYIIGPEMYDAYILLLKIVLPLVAFGMVVATIVQYVTAPPQNLWNVLGFIIGSLLGKLPDALIQVFAWLTVFFVFIERFAADKIRAVKRDTANWKPSDLPEIPKSGAILPKRSTSVKRIVFMVILLILFNIATGQFGIHLPGSSNASFQLFNFSISHGYQALVYVCFGIGIVKEIMKMVVIRYSFKFAVVNTVMGILSLVSAVIVLANMNLWRLAFMHQLDAWGGRLPANVDLSQPILIGGKVILGILIFLFVCETSLTFTRAFSNGTQEVR